MIPGVPNLLNNYPRNVVATILGNVVNTVYDFFFPAPKWGIYFTGTSNIAMQASSVVELDLAGESIVSDYQIEKGSFTTYNKVLRPNHFGVRITRDGLEYLRTDMLGWLEREVADISLFDVVCPEKTWTNATLVSYRVTRNAGSGASMLTVDCIFQEVRELPVQYSSSQIADPENQESTPTVRVNPVENRIVQATDLPPL